MASQPSTEANEVRRRGRQRLIGAIAIVLLLVVFVPMLLDPEPRPPSKDPVATIPPKESAPPLAPPPEGAMVPAEKIVAKAVSTPPVPGAPVPEPEKGAKAPEPAKVEVESTRADVPANPGAAPRLEGFAVQVGAFRDESKLRQGREKLQAAGVVHYTERLETKSGPLTRLRAGPFKSRAEAEAALARLKRGGLDGKVVPLS